MGTSSSAPLVDLSSKEKKKCVPIQLDSPGNKDKEKALEGLRKLGVEVVSAEYVVHVRPEDGDGEGKEERQGYPPPDTSEAAAAAAARASLAASVASAEAGDSSQEGGLVSRVRRSMLLTRGTVHIEAKKRVRKGKDPVEKYPNILFALRDLQVVRHAAGGDLVVLAAWNADGDVEFAMYQTPDPGRFLRPLAETLVAAHAGVPNWAIPVRWNVDLYIPSVSIEHETLLGADGGFSSTFFSSALATLIRADLAVGPLAQGPSHIAAIVSGQQPRRLFPTHNGPQCLDVAKLIDALPGGSSSTRSSLILDALGCLPFNLIFRKLSLRHVVFSDETWPARFGREMGRVLLYNVTLREIDLSGTILEGLGEDLGQALAMNIQPLISRLDLSDCRLSDRDLRGLVPGLARLWCGGSAWPESVILAGNPNVSPVSWSTLFDALADPSTLPFWPVSPPPPPTLAYLQKVDVRGTSAVGPGLARLIPKLSGLRSIAIGSRGLAGKGLGMDLVLRALADLNAPLESFVGEGMDGSCAAMLFRHSDTLRSVTLVDYCGDAAPLLGKWPEPVPKLSLDFKGNCKDSTVSAAAGEGYTPSTLMLRTESFGSCQQVINLLSTRATGLKSLYVHGMHYTELADAIPLFACSGLETLHIHPREGTQVWPLASNRHAAFWQVLATSKSLQDLQVPNQFSNNTGELVMIGGFLKANRSVRRINFDGNGFSLDVEGVMALRSAFYGNKKVISLKYLSSARARTVRECRAITEAQLREVAECKKQIKRIFRSHYSKYNSNWRAKPNQLKLPYVERIRTAKRKIGSIERDMAKISRLLNEISQCIKENKRVYDNIQREKEQLKLDRREGQLKNVAVKKQKVMSTLVTKLHKAKQRGRNGKSGKKQIPRSAYYKDKNMWPAKNVGRNNAPSSHYRYWNDPYNARYHWGYGYYGHGYYHYRHHYLNDEYDDLDNIPPITEDVCPPDPDEGKDPDGGSEVPGSDKDVEGEGSQGDNVPVPPQCVFDNDALEGFPDGADVTAFSEDNEWEHIAAECDPVESTIPQDPWDEMDGLVRSADSNMGVALTPEYLSEVHMGAAELGPDVVAELAPVLDAGAAVDAKIDTIADSMAVDRAIVSGVIDSSVDNSFDLGALESELGEIDEYTAEADDVVEDTAEADDVVEMYAGAGPRDLDDGGPSFGGASNAALAGARRRARTRKSNRVQRRIRSVASHCSVGYRNLSFPTIISECDIGTDHSFDSWPDNLGDKLMQDVTAAQIDAISKSNLFPLPDVSNVKNEYIFEWSHSCNFDLAAKMPIEVILVTQCSLDRLPNLQEQLAAWKGKASVAIHVKHGANMTDAKKAIEWHISEAKRRAVGSCDGAPYWSLALTVVQDPSDDAAYPINFLRNSALLEARHQQLKTRGATDKCAALLVDVDFRPSKDLHNVLHCEAATDALLHRRRVVVCPAFEYAPDLVGGAWPQTLSQLRRCVDDGEAEGFHLSHFPQGHGPTCFEKFWSRSLSAASGDGVWETTYDVTYQKFFEPYVCMAIDNVPLYDERFQGYGLNKVSHLASVARQVSDSFLVLPGSFLVAPVHGRSESWSQIYGSTTDEAKFNRLLLKGLYHNFFLRLEKGQDPVVSRRTMELDAHLATEVKRLLLETEGKEQLIQLEVLVSPSSKEELLFLLLCRLFQESLVSSNKTLVVLGDPFQEKNELRQESIHVSEGSG